MNSINELLADSPIALLALVCTLCACIYFRRQPQALYGLLLMLVPFDTSLKFSFAGPSISVADVVIFYFMALTLFNVFPSRRRERVIGVGMMRAIGVYALCILAVSVAVHTPDGQGLGAIISRAEGIFLVVLAPFVLRSPTALLTVVKFWSVGALLVCFVGVAQAVGLLPFVFGEVNRLGRSLFGIQLPFRRSVGIFSIYSYFSTYVLPLLALSVVFFMRSDEPYRSMRRMFLLNIGAILLAVLVTQSRSTWLSAVLMLGALHTTYALAKRGGVRFANLAVIGAAIASAVVLAPGVLDIDLLVDEFVGMRRLSVDGRIEQWGLAYQLFIENPAIGIGPKQYKLIDGENVLHNMYLLVLLEQGLLGGIAMIAFILAPSFFAWRTLRGSIYTEEVRVIGAAIFSALIGIYCEVSFAGGLPYISMWATLGIAMALTNMIPRDRRHRVMRGRASTRASSTVPAIRRRQPAGVRRTRVGDQDLRGVP